MRRQLTDGPGRRLAGEETLSMCTYLVAARENASSAGTKAGAADSELDLGSGLVELLVAWPLHEPEPGVTAKEGRLTLARYGMRSRVPSPRQGAS
jgi:hypothetical protein